MASSSCFFSSQVCASFRIERPSMFYNVSSKTPISQRCKYAIEMNNTELFGHNKVVMQKVNQCIGWSFLGGSKTISTPRFGRNLPYRKSSAVYASWLPSTQIASSAFTLGTAAVLPFYMFMVVAPKSEFTKNIVGSSIPYIALGILYAYLLYLSWTPDTIRYMFASKYWLPELPGIAKMFSSEMTLASAWIHLLAVDLFAARQVYYEGLKDNIETRHSVSLCLLFCPVGILAHFVTKSIKGSRGKTQH